MEYSFHQDEKVIHLYLLEDFINPLFCSRRSSEVCTPAQNIMVLDLFLTEMRITSRLKTACLIITLFVKPLVSKPLCDNGLYENWIAEKKDFLCCKEVNVSRGYEAMPCAEDGTEDRVQKCPNGTHQPDETSSRNSPHCIPDPTCTDLGIRKECFEGYCWPICICSLEHDKCGLNPLDCTDIKKIKCPGKVLEDCSCAPLVITSTLPTSSPNTSMNTADLSKQSSVSTLTSKPSTGSTSTVTDDRDDDTKYGSEKGNEWILIAIGFAVFVVVAIAAGCDFFKRKKDNRLKEAGELVLIPLIGQDVAVNELNIQILEIPKHTVTRQPSPDLPGCRLTDSLPEPVLLRPRPDNSNTDGTSEINNPHGRDSNPESVDEREVDNPEGRDINHSASADHGSEKADPSHQLEHKTAPDDLSVCDLSWGSITDSRSENADVNGHNLDHGSHTECGVEALSYPSIKHTETSLLRELPIGIVTPIVRHVLDNQSSIVTHILDNQSLLGSPLRIDSLLSDNSIDEAGNTQSMEQTRELQSRDVTLQTEANKLDQFQLCTKAAMSRTCGEQSGADPENTDMKVVSQNQSSEINTEAVDSENTLLMKAVNDEGLSSDLGQMTGAERTYTNINVKNKPKENFFARRNSINCRSIPTADVQAEQNKEPSQVMNSVCHTHGKSDQVLAGQNNSTQNQCSNTNASCDKRFKVVKDAKSHKLDTSQETHPVVNTQLPSFMSGDSLLQTESNNAQSMFPSSATKPGLTEDNNFVGMSLHGRQENPTLDGMYTASGEKQWSTSRQYLLQHSLLSLAQEQSALEQIPPRSVSCPVLHSKFS
ncbi:hypothetical protein CHS0354_016841 [Potamilus streckersoni]|uniref:Uncharacterized protein n=1 Tax=Potamilus streckersoni TaxID=2493646 RepID=A0AAE0SV79_9BIVA|nr:hypothetical protein CHS0354_016841 [Potamilus streckersoni]